jgi:hypothetical protein
VSPRGEVGTALEEWWSLLGQSLTRSWQKTGSDLAAFPEVAADCLMATPPPPDLNAQGVLSWLAGGRLPYQHDLGSGFGQPALTVFEGDGFVISLLFWFDETAVIHDHRFCGAFAILGGASLQTVYRYEPRASLSSSAHFGDIGCVSVELLEGGDVRPIPPGNQLIHSNIHFGLSPPDLSLVVQSIAKPAEPQRFYTHSGLTFTTAEPSPETILRLQGLRAACRISAEAVTAYLERALVDAPPDLALSYLYVAGGTPDAEEVPFTRLIASSSLAVTDGVVEAAVAFIGEVQLSARALTKFKAATEERNRLLFAALAVGTDLQRLAPA